MLNDGKGNFTWMETSRTGLDLRGELRDIALLKNTAGTYVLFLQNNESPELFKLNELTKKK